MPMELLTKAEVKRKLERGQPGKFADGKGLYLQIAGPGRASWTVQYRLNQQTKWTSIGSAFDYELSKARAKHKEIRQKAQEGIDPKAEAIIDPKAAQQIAFVTAQPTARTNAEPDEARGSVASRAEPGTETEEQPKRKPVTFAEVVEMFLALNAPGWSGGEDGQEAKAYRRTLIKQGTLANLFIDEITTDQVVEATGPWKDKPVTAWKVAMRIAKVMDYSTAKKFRTRPNPARAEILTHLLVAPPDSEPHPAMPATELPIFMSKLGELSTTEARALAYTILTAARSDETLDMRWREIDDKTSLWTVPREHMKEDKAHKVPLSPQARKLLGERGAPDDFVFQSGKGMKLWVSSMRELLATMEPDYTVHGFRSTFRDWVSDETYYDGNLAEIALAHSLGSKTTKAYARSKMVEKRRALMVDWATFACAMS
jgi:integrase